VFSSVLAVVLAYISLISHTCYMLNQSHRLRLFKKMHKACNYDLGFSLERLRFRSNYCETFIFKINVKTTEMLSYRLTAFRYYVTVQGPSVLCTQGALFLCSRCSAMHATNVERNSWRLPPDDTVQVADQRSKSAEVRPISSCTCSSNTNCKNRTAHTKLRY
jgi:hypothetical protein